MTVCAVSVQPSSTKEQQMTFSILSQHYCTLLHPPEGAYCRLSSCPEHRHAPSQSSGTTPSVNTTHYQYVSKRPTNAKCTHGCIWYSCRQNVHHHLRAQRLAGLHSCQATVASLQVLDHHLAKSVTHVHLRPHGEVWTKIYPPL